MAAIPHSGCKSNVTARVVMQAGSFFLEESHGSGCAYGLAQSGAFSSNPKSWMAFWCLVTSAFQVGSLCHLGCMDGGEHNYGRHCNTIQINFGNNSWLCQSRHHWWNWSIWPQSLALQACIHWLALPLQVLGSGGGDVTSPSIWFTSWSKIW